MNAIDFEDLFERVTPLAGRAPAEFTITPLPGYTNRNFRLHNAFEDWVLRVPRESTNLYVDRTAEAANQARACDLGIAPRVSWRDDSGLSLTPTLPGRCLTAADLARETMLRSVAATLARLHRAADAFDTMLDLPDLLERYYALLPPALKQSYRPRLAAARQILPRLRQRDYAAVPSHNDPVLENLLLVENRLWLIDWEFSAMASPCWDLAIVCNAAGLDRDRSRKLLQVYCEGAESMEESLLFDYRELLQLLSDCWMAALVD